MCSNYSNRFPTNYLNAKNQFFKSQYKIYVAF